MTIYLCDNDLRREAVIGSSLNGIDYLEVEDEVAPPGLRQRILVVSFVNGAPPGIGTANVQILGGERITNIAVQNVSYQNATLVVQVSEPGDYSEYTLSLVDGTGNAAFPGLDPVLAQIPFSFKVECETDFDCGASLACTETSSPGPDLNYLAKDFATFLSLMMNRMSLLAPDWRETSPADIGVTLLELHAYIGDRLSYRQDAVATEAYLSTARQRISVRRHARLVDYTIYEGCNARAWVCLNLATSAGTVTATTPGGSSSKLTVSGTPYDSYNAKLTVTTGGTVGTAGIVLTLSIVPTPPPYAIYALGTATTLATGLGVSVSFTAGTLVAGDTFSWTTIASGPVTLARGTEFLTQVAGAGPTVAPASAQLALLRQQQPESFESMTDATFYSAHNRMAFHNWGGVDCCLPRGATSATLRGAFPHLAAGDVLIFEETLGRATGNADDADPTRRVAVRLTSAAVSTDPLGAAFVPPGTGSGAFPITEIAWSSEDALPFPIQISETIIDGQSSTLSDSAVARGNVVLVDHGRSVTDTFTVPGLAVVPIEPHTSGATPAAPIAPPYTARLSQTPLTHAASLDTAASAHDAFLWSSSDVLPAISLASAAPFPRQWTVRGDLLDSTEESCDFVVEIDNAGGANLRFGDGEYGLTPPAGTPFTASYRVGNGPGGNVGSGSISVVVAAAAAITAVQNPIAASGGVAPESLEHVRQSAPFAFQIQERAVTAADYAAWLDQRPDVERAAATFRWTGSWYTVFNTVERFDEQAITPDYALALETWLETYRVVGKDLEVDLPRFVALDIAATVCVKPGYFRADVRAALATVFSSQRARVFDPANFNFGETVYLSALYAAAQAVDGVDSIEFTQFEPRGVPSQSGLTSGFVTMGRLQIARVANDPSFPEHGQIVFTILGGQ